MTSWGFQRLDLFILGTDSLAYHKSWNASSGWLPSLSGWDNMGRTIFSQPPVAVASAPNHLDIFAIEATTSSLRHQAWDGTRWVPSQTDWDNFGGTFVEKPAVVSWGPNRLDVFLIGVDRGLYQKFWDGNSWNNGFVSFGGIFTGPPTVVSWERGRIDVFGKGTGNNVYHKWYDSTGWHPNGISGGFELMGGPILYQPKAVSWGPNRIDLFAIGTDFTLWHKWWDTSSGVWGPAGAAGPWESLGGNCLRTPEVNSWGPGHLDIFVVGTNDGVFHKSYDIRSGWSPGQTTYEFLGGGVIHDLKAVSWGPERIDMFCIGTDSSVFQKAWQPAGGWFPSMLEYQPLGGRSRSPVS